ncbi:hypothetical protein OB03_02865 [Brevundimonas sp. GN22]
MSEREAAIQIGEALATLRRERGLSQAEAGARIGMTSQGWSLYEAGRRAGIFRPDVQKRLTQALDATPEDLTLVGGGTPAPDGPVIAPVGVSSRTRDFDPAPSAPKSPTIRFRMGSDGMAPWAFADTIIEYDPSRPPRQGGGCVVELMDGRKLVGLFAEQTASRVTVSDARGENVTLTLANVRRIAAVVARHDV